MNKKWCDKKKIKNQNLPQNFKMFIKWSKKFKTLTVSINYLSHAPPLSHVTW